MARPKVNFKFEEDAEVKDTMVALKIQLEMLKQRATLALTAMRNGKQREMQDQIQNIRQLSVRIHNLGYIDKPSDDQRLVSLLRECKYTTETVTELYRDEKLVDLHGLYDIKKLSRRFLW